MTADGETEIRHAATEPHVVELCTLLSAMGARIEGAGSSRLRVQGVSTLGGASHTLRGDYIEAGTWAVIAAVTRGAIEVRGAEPEDLEPIVSVLQRMQVPCDLDGGAVHVRAGRCVASGRLVTGLWPGFPSDMVSLFTVLATQAQGRTLIHDWMYELRLFALEQLSGMHADIFLCDSHRMVVTGPTPLRGRHLDTRDLRSGMALIAAALAAEGESVVGPLETVERGYAQVVERLTEPRRRRRARGVKSLEGGDRRRSRTRRPASMGSRRAAHLDAYRGGVGGVGAGGSVRGGIGALLGDARQLRERLRSGSDFVRAAVAVPDVSAAA